MSILSIKYSFMTSSLPIDLHLFNDFVAFNNSELVIGELSSLKALSSIVKSYVEQKSSASWLVTLKTSDPSVRPVRNH